MVLCSRIVKDQKFQESPESFKFEPLALKSSFHDPVSDKTLYVWQILMTQ